MRAFPVSDNSWLVDRCNHFVVSNHLRDNHSRDEWRLVHEDGEDWIEVKEGTSASDFINKMLEATQNYPPLDEHEYNRLEYTQMSKAVRKMAERTGTIIVHVDEAMQCLYNYEIPIVESTPMNYQIMTDSTTFKEIIEDEFPEWKAERESWMNY